MAGEGASKFNEFCYSLLLLSLAAIMFPLLLRISMFAVPEMTLWANSIPSLKFGF